MSEFKREARYIVIKTSDLAKVPTAYRSDLVDPLSRLQAHLPNRDFVVVESDWPEYEPVWQMIEARMNGETNALEAALAREADLREELSNHDSASKLIGAWVAEKGPAPWVTAVSIMAIATKMPDSERQRLLDMGDENAELSSLQQRLTDAEKKLGEAYEWGYSDGQNCPNGYSDEKDRDKCVAELTKPAAEPEALGTRPVGCCCPPKGHTGIWAAAMCPVHFGLKRPGVNP